MRVVDPTEAGQHLGLAPHSLSLSTNIPLHPQRDRVSAPVGLNEVRNLLSRMLPTHPLVLEKGIITLRSIRITIPAFTSMVNVEWNWIDEALASHVISIAKQIIYNSDADVQ